jgi:hypothetical protein
MRTSAIAVAAACLAGCAVEPIACNELAPLGDVAGRYAITWQCVGDGVAGPCAPDGNPLLAADHVTIARHSDASVRMAFGDDVVSAHLEDGYMYVDPGTDGERQRIGGSVTRCADSTIVIGIGWRTADGSETLWQALAN